MINGHDYTEFVAPILAILWALGVGLMTIPYEIRDWKARRLQKRLRDEILNPKGKPNVKS